MASRISEQIIEWLTVGGNAFSSQTNVPLLINKVGVGTATIPTTNGTFIAEYINQGQLWVLGAAAASTSVKSSQIIVSSSDAGGGEAAGIELWRGTKASWQIVNDTGDLYIRNNYTSSAQTTYSKDGIRLSYNGGAHDVTYYSRTLKPVLQVYGRMLANDSIETQSYMMTNKNAAGDNTGYYVRYNNADYARLFGSALGTANSGTDNATQGAQGYGILWLGNNIARPASGTAGGANNARGVLRLYGTNTNYTDVLSQTNGNNNFYLPNYNGTMYAIHAGSNSAIGNATKGVYIAANGRATVMTYKLEGDVVQGTAPRLAYYQGANSVQDTPHITYIDGNNSKSAAEAGLFIYGSTYGNTATDMVSGTAGLFSYSDGGPKIRFNTSVSGSQAGELIFTDNDTAGAGVSWHFVSNQSDWNVTSKRFHARTSISIGSNLPNTSYNLYINGTTLHNGIDYFANGTTYYINNSANANLNQGIFANIDNATAANWYTNAGVQIRESGRVGSAQSTFRYAPRLSFHWSSRIAATLSFHSDGLFYFKKQDGSTRALIDADLRGYLEHSYHYDGTEDWASYAWHKIAEVTNSSSQADPWIKLLVTNGVQGNICGILYCRERNNTSMNYESGHLTWDYVGPGIDVNNFVLRYTNNGTTSCKAELWAKIPGRWSGYQFIVLDRGIRASNAQQRNYDITTQNVYWDLCASVNGHGTASYTTGTGGIVSVGYSVSAKINSGTTNHIAYYSGANAVSSDPNITRDSSNMYITLSTATAMTYCLQNDKYKVGFHLAAGGNRGIYEFTNSKWLMYFPNGSSELTIPSASIYLNGNGSISFTDKESHKARLIQYNGSNIWIGAAQSAIDGTQFYGNLYIHAGLDNSTNKYINQSIYLRAGSSATDTTGTTYVITHGTGGSGTKGTYVDSAGRIKEMSYSLSATINSGTINRAAYYSATNTIEDSTYIYMDTTNMILQNEGHIYYKIPRKKADGGGWAYSPFNVRGNDDVMFANIGVYGSQNTMTYMFIGANDYNGNNFRIYPNGNIAIGSGGTIRYINDDGTWSPIQFYRGDAYGVGTRIGAGGRVIIGAGESSTNYAPSDWTSEDLHLYADGNLFCEVNANTIGNRVGFIINTSNVMYPSKAGSTLDGTMILGAQAAHWKQFYLGGLSADSRALNAANPWIEFSNGGRSQYIQLGFTDYDNQQGPSCLYIVGNQGHEVFCTPRLRITDGDTWGYGTSAPTTTNAKAGMVYFRIV